MQSDVRLRRMVPPPLPASSPKAPPWTSLIFKLARVVALLFIFVVPKPLYLNPTPSRAPPIKCITIIPVLCIMLVSGSYGAPVKSGESSFGGGEDLEKAIGYDELDNRRKSGILKDADIDRGVGDLQWTRGGLEGLQWFQPSEMPTIHAEIPVTSLLFSPGIRPRMLAPQKKTSTLSTVLLKVTPLLDAQSADTRGSTTPIAKSFSLPISNYLPSILPKNSKMYMMGTGIGSIAFICCCLCSICYCYRNLLNEVKRVPENIRIMLDGKDCHDADCNYINKNIK